MFCIEPSGVFHGYYGCAAGKAKQAATTEIEKLSMKNMTCKDLIKQAAKIIYTVHDEVKVKQFHLNEVGGTFWDFKKYQEFLNIQYF